jgi:hypothetical protein
MNNTNNAVIAAADIRGYFHDQVDSALVKQELTIADTTSIYLVNLLTEFVHSGELFDDSDDGLQIKPLAMRYADAISAPSVTEKCLGLKKLGDVALFISGLFSGSLSRNLVDVDYYVAMGGTAYSYLGDLANVRTNSAGKQHLFAELAGNFSRIVDVFGEIGGSSNLRSDSDVLRLYEIWLKTGSTRAFRSLQRLGLNPAPTTDNFMTH